MTCWVAVRAGAVAAALLLTAATASAADNQPPSQPQDGATPATGTPPSPPAAPTPPAATVQDPLDVIVCKKEPATVGSRIGARKVCKTRRQWRDETRDATSPDMPDGSLQPTMPSGSTS